MRQLAKDHVLALLTAHPDTWEFADVPNWLARQCAHLGLIVEAGQGGGN
jgi:hypothetical protein